VVASLKKRGRFFSVQFWWDGKQYIKPLREEDEDQAERVKSRVEAAIDGLKRGRYPKACGLLDDGYDIRDIIFPNQKTAHLLDGDVAADDGNPLTVLQLKDEYGRYLRNHVEHGTRRRTLSKLGHVVEFEGNRRITTLDDDSLDRYVTDRKKRKAKPLTINGELSSIRAIINWAVETKRISESPVTKYPMVKTEDLDPFLFKADIERIIANEKLSAKKAAKLSKERMILDPKDIDRLIQLSREADPDLVLPLMLVSTTGMRRSELVKLLKSDFDPDLGRLLVRSGKGSRNKRTKRTVDVHDTVMPLLVEHHRSLPKRAKLLFPIFDIPRSKRSERSDVPIEDRRADRAGRLLGDLLDGSEFAMLGGWHSLRHSFITICVWQGYSFEQVSQWSGHIHPDTQKRYTHYYGEKSKKLMNGLPFAFSEKSE
jgi:integrase